MARMLDLTLARERLRGRQILGEGSLGEPRQLDDARYREALWASAQVPTDRR